MPTPRKRKVGSLIGEALAKGQTASESDFTAAQLENLFKTQAYGHDGTSGFTHGNAGSLKKDGTGDLAEDSGLETLSEVDARMSTGAGVWSAAAKRYYMSDDTGLEGLSVTAPATATKGILHSPAGPDAKFVPKLDEVSNGAKVKFWLKPDGWGTGQTLHLFFEDPNAYEAGVCNQFKIYNADDDSTVANKFGSMGAGTTETQAHNSTNDDGFYIEYDNNDPADATENAGWHIAWEVTS